MSIAKLNMSVERRPRRVLSSHTMTSNASRSTSHMASRESSRTLRFIYKQHHAPPLSGLCCITLEPTSSYSRRMERAELPTTHGRDADLGALLMWHSSEGPKPPMFLVSLA